MGNGGRVCVNPKFEERGATKGAVDTLTKVGATLVPF
jgi:hypothetical protein